MKNAESDKEQWGLTRREIGLAISRQRWLAVAVFLVFAAVAILVASLSPSVYESRMKILVKNARLDVIVTPERTNGATPEGVDSVNKTDLNSEIQLLTARDLLTQVVREKQLDQADSSWYGGRSSGDGEVRAEKALREFEKRLRVAPMRKSNLIEVRYESVSPKQAAEVLQRVADLYLEKHLKVHRPAGTYEFFAGQAVEYEKQLRAAQDRLSTYQRELNVVSLAEERGLNLQKMIEARSNLLTTETALNDVGQRIETAQRELKNLEPRIVTQNRVLPYHQSVERLTTMLVEL